MAPGSGCGRNADDRRCLPHRGERRAERLQARANGGPWSGAFEHAGLGHGLLTFALCHDGFKDKRRDLAPQDKKIMLGE